MPTLISAVSHRRGRQLIASPLIDAHVVLARKDAKCRRICAARASVLLDRGFYLPGQEFLKKFGLSEKK
jgi:hypothetical protein